MISEAGAELATACGDALRSLVLYGSAAGSEFDLERSDVNLAVVLDPCDGSHLRRIAQWWGRWRDARLAAPLVLSAWELERSRDVFPLELLDIRARHRTLAGKELFAELVVEPETVREECEREAKGKLFRLRGLYVELSGDTEALHRLMVDSRKTFLYVIRGLLHLRGEPWLTDGVAAVRAFERRFACALPTLAGLGESARPGPIDERFAAYLAEIATLADVADREATGPAA
ncbi:MAG TPA: hypothetical protein VGK30_05825 [Candidatus Binatia bacterium]